MMERSLFLRLAESLRAWTDRIVGPGDLDVERLMVFYIEWLEKCAKYFTEDAWSAQMWTRRKRRGGIGTLAQGPMANSRRIL